jgi:hypothetical protein
MTWITLLRRKVASAESNLHLDIGQIVADGQRDPRSALRAISRLVEHRKQLVKKRKVLEKEIARGSARSIKRPSRLGAKLGEFEVAHDLASARDGEHGLARGAQLITVAEHIQAIDEAVRTLRERIRQGP